MKYILALDQGTTSSRAVLFNRNGQPVATAQQEFTQYFPQPGWVEHDALEIWQSQKNVMQEVLQKARVSASQIQSIGITNQRETSVIWDRRTGHPIAPAIVWQDRRTAGLCDKLKSQGAAAGIQKKTGLVLDAYFSATKIAWLLDHVKGARRLAEQGHLAFGTIDTWLIWQLTGGRVHVTDPSNASRTMLFNLQTQACFAPGMAKNTYGTGCFMLMNTGHVPVQSGNQLLTTVAWQGPQALAKAWHSTAYALEGSVFMAGATVQWLRDGLQIIQKASDVEALAASVPNTDDVYLVPAFAGLGAPDWDGQARGTLVGMTRGTTKAHIARAALEAIAWQVADVFLAMSKDSGLALTELRVDGGASQNNLLMQMQADALGVPVVRASVTETTALGAAYLAGLATGFWSGADEITAQWSIDRKFVPQTTARAIQARQSGHARWREAVSRSRSWAQD